jgi:hypothetical protein
VSKEAKDFFEQNPLAKIVILLDTHTAQDGQFLVKVTTGAKGQTYMHTDTLGPVSCQLSGTTGN